MRSIEREPGLINNRSYMLPFFFALILAGSCFFLCCRYSGMLYLTNDDTAIQNTLSGNYTGQPFPVHQFIGIPLGYIISRLYAICPQIQWWYVYSQTILMLSILAINFLILAAARKEKVSLVAAVFITALFDVEFLLYPIAYISFTIVPAVCGTAIVLLIFRKEKQSFKWWECAALFLVFILLLSHRISTGEVVLCYILLGLFYYFLTKDGLLRHKAMRWLITAVLLVAATFCLIRGNGYYQESINGSDFVEYNSARSGYMDYPHDSFDDNPELFEEVGWDAKVYRLVGYWCFMDERVTADNFRYLSENSQSRSEAVTLRKLWHRWNKLQGDPMSAPNEIVWGIIALTTFIVIVVNFDLMNALIFLLNMAGSGMLVLYQLYTGRIVYRSFLIVLIPAAAINLFLLIKSCAAAKREKRKEIITYVLVALMLVFSAPFAKTAVRNTFNHGKIQTLLADAEKDKAIGNYVAEHNDNFYVLKIGVTSNTSPSVVQPGKMVTNIIGWGGSEFHSRAFQERLRRNGLSELTGEVFQKGNTFFIISDDIVGSKGELPEDNLLTVFFLWMEEQYGATGIVQEDVICQGACVYRFVFDDNTENINDVYVYQDGRFALRDR